MEIRRCDLNIGLFFTQPTSLRVRKDLKETTKFISSKVQKYAYIFINALL